MSTPHDSEQLVEHFFRHEYGRTVAVLTRHFGWRGSDLVEDMVQATLLQALQSWRTGAPDNPSAWIYRVARNKVHDALRREETARRLAPALANDTPSSLPDDAFLDSEIEDSLLRMIFACSHPILPMESRLALILKTLCGFGLGEIARSLLAKEGAIKKRITRAKQALAEAGATLEVPSSEQLPEQLETVHSVLYLLFNEGYSATSAEEAIRRDLCEEAVRLCHLLCKHAHCSGPTTFALMALMLFHAARFDARLSSEGVVLLEDQDRSLWDRDLIQQGLSYLSRSASGNVISRFHLEAGIAMYHCKAATCEETNWPAILRHYDLLLRLNRSPIYLLNRAVALSYVEGPESGLRALDEVRGHPQLRNYPLLDATLGELHRRAGRSALAADHFRAALSKTTSASDRQTLERKLSHSEDR